jgi:hypothetical protein
MSIYLKIQDNLYDAVHEALSVLGWSNVVVVFSSQNIREPENTYCLINILDIEQQGFRDEGTFLKDDPIDPEKGYLEFIAHYFLQVRFSFIGDSADVVAADFKHNIPNNRACIDEFRRMGWGILNRSGVRRVPQPRDTKWVEMFNMDMDLSFSIHTEQEYGWVEKVGVLPDYIDKVTINVNDPIVIPPDSNPVPDTTPPFTP